MEPYWDWISTALYCDIFGNLSSWQQVSKVGLSDGLQQLAVGSATLIWGVDKSGKAYRYNTGTSVWDPMTVLEPLAWVTVSSDGAICAVGGSQKVYSWKYCAAV